MRSFLPVSSFFFHAQTSFSPNASNSTPVVYDFAPDTASTLLHGGLAPLYNLSDSQTASTDSNTPFWSSSYWSSSFITGSNNHQYLVISHKLAINAEFRYFRGSILDITQPEYYSQFLIYYDDPEFPPNVPGIGYGFEALSADKVSKQRTWSTNPDVGYDITIEATASALLNGGTGAFTWGSDTCSQWAMPAGRTTGTLTINDTKVNIDPDHSRTWYDRQWGPGAPTTGNWTWFALQFQNSGMRVSAWSVDNEDPYQRARFATVQTPDGSHQILPTTLVPNTQKMFTSSATNTTYPLEWELSFANGDSLTITSLRPDQEIVATLAPGDCAYQGFVTFSGQFWGKDVKGFGAVEMTHLI